MKINDHIITPDNYRFSVAENEVLARIISEQMGTGERGYEMMLRALKDGFQAAGVLAVDCLKKYRGSLLQHVSVTEYANIVPSVLRNELASLISGNTVTPTFKANYFALGSGSSTPANSDTALQTETLRALFTDRSYYTNIAYLDVFFPSSSVGGNSYTEAGVFVDGSGSADSGYLLSRVSINQVLGSNQTLTVNGSITVS